MLSAAISFVGTAYAIRAAADVTALVIGVPAALLRVNITAAGTAAVTFYDNVAGTATGPILGALPAATTVGQSFEFMIPATLGITSSGGAGTPGYSLVYQTLGKN